MSTKYRCANLRRAALVRDDATINGLDYLEVVDQDAPSDDLRQRILVLHLFKSAALTADNIRIEGGVRVRPIRLDGQPQVNGESSPCGQRGGRFQHHAAPGPQPRR